MAGDNMVDGVDGGLDGVAIPASGVLLLPGAITGRSREDRGLLADAIGDATLA